MPLKECDTNSLRLPGRQNTKSYSRLHEEKSPCDFRTKNITRVTNFLQPTAASVAKAGSAVLGQPHFIKKSISPPLSRLRSRPPQHATNPAYTTTIDKPMPAASPCVRPLRSSANETRMSPSLTSEVSPCGMGDFSSASQPQSFGSGISVPTTHKPLPPRPIASLVTDPSPSKDSRSLVDAIERPLQLSIGGSGHDWPTLLPAISDASLNRHLADDDSITQHPEQSPSMRLSLRVASLKAAASACNAVITDSGKLQTPKLTEKAAYEHATPVIGGSGDLPSRSSSLPRPSGHVTKGLPYTPRSRISSGNLMARMADLDNSFNQSQLSTNFSRPELRRIPRSRESVEMHRREVSLTSIESETLRTAKQERASRIPIPDSKKATLVSVKRERSPWTVSDRQDSTAALSFGGRRINSPDPLKVLDHGIRRRNLIRTSTNDSSSTNSTVPTRFVVSNRPSTGDLSKTSSRAVTAGSSSEDEEEVTTPQDRSTSKVSNSYKPNNVKRLLDGYDTTSALRLLDDSEVVLGRPPPSSSPYTVPLQTIPSQSLLPVNDHDDYDTHPAALESGQWLRKSGVSDNLFSHRTRSDLMELLRDVSNEDAQLRQHGSVGLDEETWNQVSRTLSTLEGDAGPGAATPHSADLLRMFSSLRKDFEKKNKGGMVMPTTASAVVERPGESPLPFKISGGTQPISQDALIRKEISQWSSTTPSDDATSPKTVNFNPHVQSVRSNVTPADPPGRSIGYPSRTPIKSPNAGLSNGTWKQVLPEKSRPDLSSSLGKRAQGSVRAARERMRSAGVASSSKMTSNKNAREVMPTSNTKKFDPATEEQRGRMPSIGKKDTKAVDVSSAKVPRSRSKSRYVLNKINGMFSHSRDKLSLQFPTTLHAKDKRDRTNGPNGSTTNINQSHADARNNSIMKTSPVPPLTKMPTISPQIEYMHPALRAGSSAIRDHAATGSSDSKAHSTDHDRHSLQAWSEKLIGRAKREVDPAKKERLLNFAKVLNDSLISAREAEISAETAQNAARNARVSYEMTVKSVAMLQRLAVSMNRRS